MASPSSEEPQQSQESQQPPPQPVKDCSQTKLIQFLGRTAPIVIQNDNDDSSDVERKRDCPFCILERRIVRSLSLDLNLDAPAKIQSCLRIFAEHFRCVRQEDAHEFLCYVIDACHNTCLRLKKLRRNINTNDNGHANGKGQANGTTPSSTVVMEIFGGALQSQVKCLSCGSESNKVDEILDISLDVLHSNSLKDALQRFFHSLQRCNKLVAARKQMSILQAPNVLVIQRKRLRVYLAGRLINPLHLKSFWCFPASCAKQARIHDRNISFLVLLCILVSHLSLVIIVHILRMQWVVGIAAMIRLSRFQLCKMSCLKRFTSFSSLVPTKGRLILLQMGQSLLIVMVMKLPKTQSLLFHQKDHK